MTIALLGMIVLGIFTLFASGGILGEEKIYGILGGMERNAALLFISKIFAFIGSPTFLVPAIIIAVTIAFYYKRRILALGLILSTGGSFLFNTFIKEVFKRARPVAFMLAREPSYSYPSGHTVTNACLYLFLAFYLSRNKSPETKGIYYVVAIFFSILMGLSRVYLGVHYPTDVLGGFMSAYFLNYLLISLLKKSKYSL